VRKRRKRSDLRNRVILYVLAIVWLVVSGILLQWSVFMYKAVVYDLSMVDFAARNLLRLLLGVFAFLFGMWMYRLKQGRWANWVFYASMGLLVMTYVAGKTFGGASRWIALGPFTFQPSEFVKYALILYLANIYVSEGQQRVVGVFWKSLIISGFVSMVILFQPNLSTAVVLLGAVVITLFLLGATLPQLAASFGFALFMGVFAYNTFGHVRERVKIFLGKSGSSYKAAQVVQAKVSIVRGGLLGKGPGMGLQKLGYLPSADKDYAFSNLFEEYGVLGIPGGALWIVLAIVIITWVGLWAAQRNGDPFRRFVMVGFVVVFFTFSFVHIAVNLGMLPPTGLPLPFVSYGGSALVANAVALGYVFRGVLDAG